MVIKKAFMHLIAHDIDVLHGNRLKNKKGKPSRVHLFIFHVCVIISAYTHFLFVIISYNRIDLIGRLPFGRFDRSSNQNRGHDRQDANDEEAGRP